MTFHTLDWHSTYVKYQSWKADFLKKLLFLFNPSFKNWGPNSFGFFFNMCMIYLNHACYPLSTLSQRYNVRLV